MCGYARYTADERRESAASAVTAASIRIARYDGEFPQMSGRVIRYRIGRRGNRVGEIADCPFCGAETQEASLSGKRRDVTETRFQCPQEHRFSLVGKDARRWR